MTKKNRAREVLQRLTKEYPQTGPFIEWSTHLELVIGTVLSAQCTDVRVNMVTKELFKKYKTPEDYANAELSTLEKEIYSTGFYRSKAKYLKGIGEIILRDFDGNVPDTLDGLLSLPGVSNKTAYIVLSKAFGKNEGVAVDTHVLRITPRLGLSTAKSAQPMSKDLMKILDPENYLRFNEYLITHGRAICSPGIPDCGRCVLADICPSAKKFLAQKEKKKAKK